MLKNAFGTTVRATCLELIPVRTRIEGYFNKAGKQTFINHGTDGVHSAGSLHPAGYAEDYHIAELTEYERKGLITHLRLYIQVTCSCSGFYDIILHKTHLHVEFDILRLNKRIKKLELELVHLKSR